MRRFAGALLSTLRERRDIALPLGLWVLISATAAITGPFQTYDLLAPWPRTVYWTFVVGLSVVFGNVQLRVLRRQPTRLRLVGWVPFSVVLAGIFQALNLQVFPQWLGWPDYLWLFSMVLSVCLLLELADALLRSSHAPRRAQPMLDPTATLLDRLPPDQRGRLIRIEARDHYLLIVTSAGSDLILMRMADAEALLAGADGVRVHRSHWVMKAEVLRHKRRDGRDLLVMSDDSEVPISRNARAVAQEAGLIPLRAVA
jgi:hypothetical protein